MARLEYSDVAEIVNSLDREFEPVREQAERRYDLYRMKRDPYVPDDVAREGKFRSLSALVDDAVAKIRSDLMMNPTEFTVVPLSRDRDGTIPRTATMKAENIERSLAILWGKLNEGRRIDRQVIWHQLVSPYAVIMLEFAPYSPPEQPEGLDDDAYVALCEAYDAAWIPWRLHCPEPLTCSWVERDDRPVIFARRYKIVVNDLLGMYSFNPTSTYPDHKLAFIEDRFAWVSDDYDPDTSEWKAGFREVEVLWLDDGINMYQAVCNPSGGGENDGVLLTCLPNPVGRPMAFIIPGNITPARKPEDKYEPFLLPLMQTVNDINNIRSTRATAARNLAGPHTFIPIDPEIVKLYRQRGETLPTNHRWKKNETPYLLGDVKAVPSELSVDWDKLEMHITEDLQRFLPSQFVNVIDPAVLKAATATSILHAAEAGMRVYGPLMSAYDAAIRDICEVVLISVRTYYTDESVLLHATGEEVARKRNLTAGAKYKLDSHSVDFQFRLLVRTHGMSQAQAAAQYQAVLNQWILPDGSKGPATLEDLIDAANYTDPVAQRMKLAKEAILETADPWIQQMAIESFKQTIEADSNIVLPMGQQMGAPPPEGGSPGSDVTAMPNNAQRMDAPLVLGPSGGSSPLNTGMP